MAKLVFDPKTQRYWPALKRRDLATTPEVAAEPLQKPIRTVKHLTIYQGGRK